MVKEIQIGRLNVTVKVIPGDRVPRMVFCDDHEDGTGTMFILSQSQVRSLLPAFYQFAEEGRLKP